jgi:nucleoside-diphosphate-sugar epimerase
MTSSFVAVGYSATPREEYTEADWTDPADPNSAYTRSKVFAERAAWDFVRDGPPELTVINPVGILGPVLDAHVSVSVALVKAMPDGNVPAVPRMCFGLVDVRDLVDLHVRAMTHPRAPGERFLAVSGRFISMLDLARILADNLGERAARVPTVELADDVVRAAAAHDPGMREAASWLGRVPVVSNTKARTLLDWQPRGVETTIVDTAVSLLGQPFITS